MFHENPLSEDRNVESIRQSFSDFLWKNLQIRLRNCEICSYIQGAKVNILNTCSFWRLCITLAIPGFLDFAHHLRWTKPNTHESHSEYSVSGPIHLNHALQMLLEQLSIKAQKWGHGNNFCVWVWSFSKHPTLCVLFYSLPGLNCLLLSSTVLSLLIKHKPFWGYRGLSHVWWFWFPRCLKIVFSNFIIRLYHSSGY
jgi:hypothetical protein